MEEDQDAVLNDLLNRIKSLEERNAQLKESIAEKEKILSSTQPIESSSSLYDEEVPKISNIFDDTEESIPIELRMIQQNESQIHNNVIEYTIDFIPTEQISKLYISGDFTNWDLKPMVKNKDVFSYTVVLLKNFKYYYTLSDMSQNIVDLDKPTEINPVNNIEQNYIDLCASGKPKNLFNPKFQNNILEVARRNFMILKMGNIKEANFLLEIQKNANIYNEKYNNISNGKNTLLDSITSYYDKEIREISPINKDTLKSMISFFKGRILCKVSSNANQKETHYYEIEEISESYVNAIELYDQNHIKCNYEYYLQNRLFNVFSLDSITCDPISDDSIKIHVLSEEESTKIVNEFKNDNDNLLRVYYKKEDPGSEGYKKYGNHIMYPTRIEPERVNPNDYVCEGTGEQIVEVKHKVSNMSIKFIAYEDIVKKDKKPAQITLYYSIDSKTKGIKLIHGHILDPSFKGKKIITQTIDSKCDFHKIKKEGDYIKKDMMILLVRSMMPFRLYYNKKKVHIESFKICVGKIYRITSDSMNSAFNHFYVKVDSANENKSTYDIGEECSESISLYEAPDVHRVDVSFMFDEDKNAILEEMRFSFTPCLLKPVEAKEETALMTLYENKKAAMFNEAPVQNDSYEMKKFELIIKEMKKFEKYRNDESLIKNMTKDDIENNLFMLDDYKSSMNSIGTYIEQNELWDYIARISLLSVEIDDYIKLFNKYK